MYAKISKKGQITIPKPIREKLNIDHMGGVLFLIEDNEVKLKGVPGQQADALFGNLSRYARQYVPLEKIRGNVKGKVAHEAAQEGLSD